MANADKDILYRVAYDEAVRALSEQQAVIDSFRTRAGLVLSAAAITTSFLGAQALEGGQSHWAAWLALVAFIGVAVMSVAIPAPIEELHRDLSLHMHNSYTDNRKGLEQLAAFFQIASGLLAVEVVLWIIAIASTPENRDMAQTPPPSPPPEPKRPSPMQPEIRGASGGKTK